MTVIYWTLYILVILFLGSFLGSLASGLMTAPFRCIHCNKPNRFLDWFPFYYYRLNGKCPSCGANLSKLQPIGEFLTLFVFVMIPIYKVIDSELFIISPFFIALILLTLTDIKYHLMPDKIVYPSIAIIFLLRLFFHQLPLWNYILGAVVSGSLLLFMAMISNGGIGGGDIKIFFLIGLTLGFKDTLLAFFLSSAFGAILGVILMLLGIVKRKQLVAFGPYIFLGTITSYFYADSIWNWYLAQ